MNKQQVSRGMATTKSFHTTVRLAIFGALVLLAGAAGAGAWHVFGSGTATPPAAHAPQPLPAKAAVAPASGDVKAGPVVYLTDSKSAQALAESDLDAAAAVRRTNGDATQTPQVVVITSAAGEGQLRQAIGDQNRLRATLGLSEITLVDLRPAGAPAAPNTRSGSRSPVLSVLYLVASEEQAAAVRSGLDDAERIRVADGGPPNAAAVVVVTSAVDEAQLRQANDDTNSFRASLGLPDIALVDLRP